MILDARVAALVALLQPRPSAGLEAVATDCAELALWLTLAFAGEHLLPTAPRTPSADLFFGVCAVAVMHSICGGAVAAGSEVALHRGQTDEWRGWMQVL